MTYFFHLVTPFLLIFIIKLANKTKKTITYLTMLVSLLFWSYQILGSFNKIQVNQMYWNNWKTLLLKYQNIYNSPLIAHFLLKDGKRIYETGQNEYFYYGAKFYNDYDLSSKYLNKYYEYTDMTNKQIEQKKFDLVTITKNNYYFFSKETLSKYYQLKETNSVSLFNDTWPTEIWEPKI
jgi:hypothetical protein